LKKNIEILTTKIKDGDLFCRQADFHENRAGLFSVSPVLRLFRWLKPHFFQKSRHPLILRRPCQVFLLWGSRMFSLSHPLPGGFFGRDRPKALPLARRPKLPESGLKPRQ
jgi:hypothetical protein